MADAADSDDLSSKRLRHLLGAEWDEELEPFRYAGEVPRSAGSTRSADPAPPGAVSVACDRFIMVRLKLRSHEEVSAACD